MVEKKYILANMKKTINLINKLQVIVTQKQYDCHAEIIHVFRAYVTEEKNI